ncbi:MAG: CoA-binding protein [Dehalococcoidia bacterium]|nr:CoA-binding protein [Dehalococcoidia bacterium]MQG16511.1 CoA-binding protein [SAR202 cluster bacterium]|tara:strand:+ start:17618 stop:18025 length:408 start_codon:yes stop_codon:yes gene_type:complete
MTKTIDWIFNSTKTIAIVGLSDNPNRPSNQIGSYLLNYGYEIIPVNPNIDSVFGIKSYADLLHIPVQIDLVNIFRRSKFIQPIVEAAIKIGVKSIWMQDGVEDVYASKLAINAGIMVVMDDCVYRQHKVWLRQNN